MSDKKLPEKAELGKYPYNLVTVFADGAELHRNMTPGNFTTRYFTHLGSGFEIDKNGRFTMTSANNSFNYSKGGVSNSSDKNVDNKSGGGSRSVSDGGAHNESGGNVTNLTNGTSANISKGGHLKASPSASNGEEIINGNQVKKITGSDHKRIEGDSVNYVKGQHITHVSGESSLQVEGNKSEEISGKNKTIVAAEYTIEVPKLIFKCGGTTVVIDGDGVTITGGNVKHNNKNIGFDHKHTQVLPGSGISGVPQ